MGSQCYRLHKHSRVQRQPETQQRDCVSRALLSLIGKMLRVTCLLIEKATERFFHRTIVLGGYRSSDSLRVWQHGSINIQSGPLQLDRTDCSSIVVIPIDPSRLVSLLGIVNSVAHKLIFQLLPGPECRCSISSSSRDWTPRAQCLQRGSGGQHMKPKCFEFVDSPIRNI